MFAPTPPVRECDDEDDHHDDGGGDGNNDGDNDGDGDGDARAAVASPSLRLGREVVFGLPSRRVVGRLIGIPLN